MSRNAPRIKPTQERLKELFEYRNGDLIWKVQKARRLRIGDKAGSVNSKGYIQVFIDNKGHRLHRLIWLYHHGTSPVGVDHINGDKLDNRIENLREANQTQNNCNQRMRSDNKSGIKGVSWCKLTKKWVAQLQVHGQKKCLGRYERIEDAKQVVMSHREQLHGEFARQE